MYFRSFAFACLCVALGACKPTAPNQAGQATAESTPAARPGSLAKAAAAPSPLDSPLDSPLEEMEASTALFLKARSYHAVMSTEGAQGMNNEIDFVAPDRFRMKMPMGTQVIIGDTMYMQVDGRSMKMPMPKGTLTQMRDPLRSEQTREDMSVEALGSDRVDGQSTKKYRVRHSKPAPGEFTLWIGSNGLPLQFVQQGEAQGKPYTMTMRYSRFNDPTITIDAPQ